MIVLMKWLLSGRFFFYYASFLTSRPPRRADLESQPRPLSSVPTKVIEAWCFAPSRGEPGGAQGGIALISIRGEARAVLLILAFHQQYSALATIRSAAIFGLQTWRPDDELGLSSIPV